MRGCCDNNNIEKYIDVSCIPTVEWDVAGNILGTDKCGNILVLDKPLYELSGEDREKLDKIIITGSGNNFLADDGTYKNVTEYSIVLTYTANPNDFTATNLQQLAQIREKLSQRLIFDVYININGFHYPLNVSYSDETLILGFDEVLYDINTREISPNARRLRFEAVIHDNSLVNYEFTYTDAGVIKIDGEGNSFLADNGEYIDLNPSGIVYYNENDDILTRNNIILANDHKLLGTSPTGEQFNLIELSRWNIIDLGSVHKQLNFNSSGRPTVQLTGETGEQVHPIAFLSDVTYLDEELQEHLREYNIHITDYNGFRETVNNTFEEVSGEIGGINERVTSNETNIQANADNIQQLRDDFTNEQHYKGTFLTNAEIQALEGESGAYAYSIESGTKWVYNTNTSTWEDSGEQIPSGIVSPSDTLPVMDGTANAGISTSYARGDHRHPSDTTKANVTDLDKYLPLAGNTQLTKMDGDIWMGTGNHIRLTDSGNSYIVNENETTVVNSTGTGGINFVTPNGTTKVNGSPIATTDNIVVNGINEKNVQVSAPIIQLNASQGNPTGFSMALGTFQLSGNSLFATLTGSINITTTGGNVIINPTAYKFFYGSPDFPNNEVSTIGNVEEAKAEMENRLLNYYNRTETDALLDSKADSQDLGNYLPLSGGNITGSLTINDAQVATLDNIPGISSSDNILTLDNSGLKGNLSIITENGIATFYGKDNTVIGTINLSTGDIQDAYYDEENKELIFVIRTETGTDTITIPVGDLIQTYTGSGYISIDNENNITLNYNLLADQLLNDNFIKSDALNNYYTKPESNSNLTNALASYLPLSGGIITGETRFNGTFTRYISPDGSTGVYTHLLFQRPGSSISAIGTDESNNTLLRTINTGENLIFDTRSRNGSVQVLTGNGIFTHNGDPLATLKNIPDVSGFATKIQLDAKADRQDASGNTVVYAPNGVIDTSGFATKQEVSLKADTTNEAGEQVVYAPGGIVDTSGFATKTELDNYLPKSGGTLSGGLTFSSFGSNNVILNNNILFLAGANSANRILHDSSTGKTIFQSGATNGMVISNVSETGNIEFNTSGGKVLVNDNEVVTSNNISGMLNIREETLSDWIFSVKSNEVVNLYYELTQAVRLVDQTPNSVTKATAFLTLVNNKAQQIRVTLPASSASTHNYYISASMSGTNYIDVPASGIAVIQFNYTEAGAIITLIDRYIQLI